MTTDRVRLPPADLARLTGARTRFAPAPTGWLHPGHLVNAIFVWGIARVVGGTVVLRIEDHDRQRCRPEYEAGLLDDLERLALLPDEPPIAELRAGWSAYRQSDDPAPYEAALARLRDRGLVYACDCSHSTFARHAVATGRPWQGPGCPGRCRERRLPEPGAGTLRVALGEGTKSWDDLFAGALAGEPALAGDPPVRDRSGNWTYAFCVVVDDLRHGIDLVVRGRDLLDATPAQLRLARLVAGGHPARFLHHPLLLRPDGSKLSKADGATAIRELLDAGRTPGELLADVARRAGFDDVPPSLDAERLSELFRPAAVPRPEDDGAVTRRRGSSTVDSAPW